MIDNTSYMEYGLLRLLTHVWYIYYSIMYSVSMTKRHVSILFIFFWEIHIYSHDFCRIVFSIPSTLGVESIFESDITAYVLLGQHPSHFTKSAVVIVLYFLQEVFP